MHNILTSDRVRIKNSEPLVLAVSALVDYLWEDFVIDSRPMVSYLSSEYNIAQLSRFGKELFERLYQGDEGLHRLVTEQAYEDWFRAKQDGEAVGFPEGYKPENSIWYMIMNDLSNAGSWPQLLAICVGDQFNSGNNAINILNDLSEVIQEQIDQGQIDPDQMFNGSEQLQELRDAYSKAMAAGDTEAAAAAREAGKQLAEAMQAGAEKTQEVISQHVDEIVDNSINNNDNSNDQISSMWGTGLGQGTHLPDLQQKKELARKLQKDKKLAAIARRVGALKKIWQERKRAKKVADKYDAIAGASMGNDITKAFATELAAAGTEAGKALFCLKYSQKTLMIRDYESKRKDLGRGPIEMYVDVSGSMSGESELFSKAIAFVIAEHARKEKRKLNVYLFDVEIQNTLTLTPDAKNNAELLDFLGTWTLGGGTDFGAVIEHVLSTAKPDPRADIVMLTDGHSRVGDAHIKRLNKYKTDTGTTFATICINMDPPQVVHSFSDEVTAINVRNPDDCVQAFQKQLVK